MRDAYVSARSRRPDLRWHYRSIHPSLIQPSNELFYDNRLVVFPCAYSDIEGHRVGVVFHHMPEATYEAGAGKRVNRSEAEVVAQAVYRHACEHPDESLMVAAMNKPQADLIADEVAKHERRDPSPFARFRAAHPFEQLDHSIKNLENVQGDERDVVFISVTYGKDQSGVMRHHFGPLSRDGGERRLNVLISRSRKRCEVFSSITDEDLRSDIAAPGVVALRRYLSYARTGSTNIPIPTGEPEESPFEEEVTDALRLRGYEVHTQVGCEGYRIDLAVLDPDKPGRYLVGVECDGATYHSAQSARDRDKLRQVVLEHRGWRLHRIWSPDWWRDKDGEIARLVEAIESARNGGDIGRAAHAPAEPEVKAVEVAPAPCVVTRPYVCAKRPAHIRTEDDLRTYTVDVVSYEGPIQHELLVNRIRNGAGYGRTGHNLRSWFAGLILEAVRSGKFVCVEAAHIQVPTSQRTKDRRSGGSTGDAYLNKDRYDGVPRDWSMRPATERKSNFVPLIEIAAALRLVIGSACGIDPDEAVRRAFYLIGFRRTTEDAVARGRTVLKELARAKEILARDGQVVLASERPQ